MWASGSRCRVCPNSLLGVDLPSDTAPRSDTAFPIRNTSTALLRLYPHYGPGRTWCEKPLALEFGRAPNLNQGGAPERLTCTNDLH